MEKSKRPDLAEIRFLLGGFTGEVSGFGLLEDLRAGRWDEETQAKFYRVLDLIAEAGTDPTTKELLEDMAALAVSTMLFAKGEQLEEIAVEIEGRFETVPLREYVVTRKENEGKE